LRPGTLSALCENLARRFPEARHCRQRRGALDRSRSPFTADKDINAASVNAKLKVSAAKEIILECGGAFVRIADGSVTLGGPGDLFIKTITVQKKGPLSMFGTTP
jgi:type VI secretion system secreted protein VgrG